MDRRTPDQPPDRAAAWVPLVVLLVSLCATVASTAFVSRASRARDHDRFNGHVDRVANDLVARIDVYLGYLRAAAGLFAATEDLTRAQWRAFFDHTQVVKHTPGLQGIGFSRRLATPEAADAALRELRDHVSPAARLWPPHDDDERHAIVYLEPSSDPRNVNALGYDMFTEPARRQAMLRARDEAQAVATARVTLVQERDEQPARQQAGFLIYVPVYGGGGPVPETVEQRRERLVGFVYSPFRADDLIGAIFNEGSSPVRFDLYDGTPRPENLLRGATAGAGNVPRFTGERRVTIAGRPWTLAFASLPRFDDELAGRNLAPWVFAAGVVVSFVLFLLARAQAAARRAAERAAHEVRRSESALRLSEARFRRLAESNLIGVVFCDVHGKISRANLEFFRLVGHDRTEVLSGRVRMDTLTPADFRAADAVALAQLRSVGVAEPYEKELIRVDGQRVPVLVGMAMLEGSTTECVAFCIDLTPSKQAARELQRAKELAENANRAKDQFLAALSHELRTPLTPVLAVATAAHAEPALPEQARADFAMIRRNVELEAKLIDDLLDLTRVGRGKVHLHLETIDAHQVVQHAINVSDSEEVAAKQLVIEVELAAERHHVRGDAARLQQVFWNLLKNAVKFTPAGGKVAVRTSNDAARRLVVRVSDTGVGIEPHLLPRIFDAFEQGEIAMARSLGGLGLGLAISKGLVAAHCGTIAAHSDGRGRGATFTVTLDTVDAPARLRPAAPTAPAAGPDAASRLSILLVEDHADTANALKRLLDRCGYEVRAAHSVESALDLAAQTDFDVLVSDLGLPDGSGLDIMRHLSESRAAGDGARAGKRPRGIALTGYGMEEDVAKTRAAGFDEHITKPVNFQNLQQAIERVTTPQ
jgi:PAS domain S-box-containing protein